MIHLHVLRMKSTKLTVFLIIIAIAAGWTGRGILEQNKKEALVKAIATIQMEVPMTALELLEKEEYKDLRYHLGLRMCDGFITYENNNFLGEDEETIELFEQSYALWPRKIPSVNSSNQAESA